MIKVWNKCIWNIFVFLTVLMTFGNCVAIIASGIGIEGNAANKTFESDPQIRLSLCSTTVPDNNSIGSHEIKISDIKANPEVYVGGYVTISGEYRGWYLEEGESPPVTRSDWILRDGTGEIYVTGKPGALDPMDDIGKEISVYGIVSQSDKGKVFTKAQAVIKAVDCGIPSIIEKLSEAPGEKAANWTFMVYLDGDNNLEKGAIIDLNEMEIIGSSASVNIVVQFDRHREWSRCNGDWMSARRYYVIKDADIEIIGSTLIQDLGEVNMADPNTLVDFVEWTIKNYPATNYALILWDHGSGIWGAWTPGLRPPKPGGPSSERIPWEDIRPQRGIKNEKSEKEQVKGIISDEMPRDQLSVRELKQALETIKKDTGKKIDVLGFDACLMQMVEIGYQISDYTDVIVGSEEEEPIDGWPYDTILRKLTSNPSMTPNELGSEIVADYIAYYGTDGDETLSAANKTKLLDLASAIDNFAQVLNGSLSSYYNEIAYARIGSESYYDNQFVDLYHFAELIYLSTSNSTIRSAAVAVMDNTTNTIFAKGHGLKRSKSHGLSIYFPLVQSSYRSWYECTDFAIDTNWNDFLKGFYNGGALRVHNMNTSKNFSTIQAAIDDSNTLNGHTIIVDDGIYVENVNIDKSLRILSENGSASTIVLANSEDFRFTVTADYVNISGFTAVEGGAGIYLENANHCSILNNNVLNNTWGICLNLASRNTIANNNASNNRIGGISMWDSNDNILANNILSNNSYGIYLDWSSNNTLTKNTMSRNDYNFGLVGDSLSHFVQIIDTSNRVDEKPVYYLVGRRDEQIPEDAGFVGVVNSTNITIKDLTLKNNLEGLLLAYSTNSRIENVTASNNIFGFLLWCSSNNKIINNIALKNYESYWVPCYGIYLGYSSNNALTNNIVSNNRYGIYLEGSTNHSIYLNNFMNNTDNVRSSKSANTWNSTESRIYTFNGTTYTNYLGNYWDDYTGTDAEGDGIGDTHYSIDGDNDNYPLMMRFEKYIARGGIQTIKWR